MTYAAFLAGKHRAHGQLGAQVEPGDLHPMLHPWQAEATAWAIRKGRCAIWWDCGLGKTFAQIEWATHSAQRSLILAPLSVARQTVRRSREASFCLTDTGRWALTVGMIEDVGPA